MKTVVISGGGGFIGSHLVDAHLAQGDKVIVIDSFISGLKDNLAHLKDNNNFTLIEEDVCKVDFATIGKADYVYHLASPASPNHHSPISYHALAMETMLVNTDGTMKMADFALQHGARFLFSSTSEIYGDPIEHPQKETYNGNASTHGPRSVYDEAKRFGETITSYYQRDKGLDTRIVRIFNTYGPRMRVDDKRMIVNFILQALKNEDITLYGAGSQTRSLCFVDDLVVGLMRMMELDDASGVICNMGTDEEYTVREYAEMIKRLTGSKSAIVDAEELPKDDPQKRQPDLTLARSLLQWSTPTSIEDGMKKTISYFTPFAS